MAPWETTISGRAGGGSHKDEAAHATEEAEALLSDLGLSASEVAVFLATLSLGTRPASIIAQRAGLKRGQTYNVLAALLKKGMMQEIIKNGVRHFCCSSPDALVSIIEGREKELSLKKQRIKTLIPRLERLQNPIAGEAKARFYRGLDGVKEIFEDMLRTGEDMYSIVDLQHSWSSVSEEAHLWVQDFIRRREKKDIWWNAIALKSEASDREMAWRSRAKRRVKALEGVEIPAEINIYGNKVALTSISKEMIGVVIESAPIVRTLYSIHQLLWKLLPDYRTNGAVGPSGTQEPTQDDRD